MKGKSAVNSFKMAADARKVEQEQIEKMIKEGEKRDGRGRPPKVTEPCTTVTLRMTESRKKKLKVYAAKTEKTISDIVAEIIDSLGVEDGNI